MRHLFRHGLAALLLVMCGSAAAQVPTTIAYQGYLTDAGGNPLDGTVNLAFRLYDAPAGGTARWAESQLDVPVAEGVFAVRLGTEESLDGVAFDQPLWLAVRVNGGNELAPRVALDAAPYSLSTRGLRVIPASSGTSAPVIAGDAGTVSIVAGAASNAIEEGADSATISGGSENRAGDGATVGGGRENGALDCYDTVGGGRLNRADSFSSAANGKVSGASRCHATVGGGYRNAALSEGATVAGGEQNIASGRYSAVGGGDDNVAGSSYSGVGGGYNNVASGSGATVPGGRDNQARGDFSFAAGRYARAVHDGTFVWSDPSGTSADSLVSTAENQFLIRAAGGVGIGTNAPQGAVHVTHAEDDFDLVLGGAGQDALFGDDGTIASDPALPSSDLLLVSNDAVGVLLDVDNSGETAEFIVADSGLDEAFRVDLSGSVTTGRIALENDLASDTTPVEGGVYRDNVVYAWAHVNADGSVAASFGCTVLRTGTGQYRVTYDLPLTNGAAPVVSPLSANDPVMAIVAPSGTDRANVKVFEVVNGQFQFGDRPFFIQVVGRP